MENLGYSSLHVYKNSYKLAMEIFTLSKSFPLEEKYSLTDQVRRSSRSVPVNIACAYRRRKYPKHFSSKITDADEECTETMEWLKFACDCKYLDENKKTTLLNEYIVVGKMLGTMADNPEKFLPR